MRNAFLLPLALLFAGVGCGPDGPPMGTVAGKLTIGGAPPVEPIRVTFVNTSIGQGAAATVGKDGAYSLESPLPLTEYRIFVSKILGDTGGPVSTAKEMLMTVQKEFRSEETTPLKFSVKQGANEFHIEIPAVAGAK